MGPLLTSNVHRALRAAAGSGVATLACSLDLDRSTTNIEIGATGWRWEDHDYPYLESCKDRTIYYWTGTAFEPAARFTTSFVKLVPTDWGAPTFEIDGIKMLRSEHVSPYVDAQRKVALIRPRDKVILDTCGGLGYFAACCLESGAQLVLSCEKNADVMWLRTLNPWSPQASSAGGRLRLTHADITDAIVQLPDESVDAILHDPPRFGIAGELYSATFYEQLARVLRRNGTLFHYTGSPNTLTSGRDVPREVMRRLNHAGFVADLHGDGVLGRKS